MIYIVICLNVAVEEAFGILGDNRLVELDLFNFFEVISSIHLPSPRLQETDMDGIDRAIQRATHAHQAMMLKTQHTVGVSVNVLRRTSFDT